MAEEYKHNENIKNQIMVPICVQDGGSAADTSDHHDSKHTNIINLLTIPLCSNICILQPFNYHHNHVSQNIKK
jgi:hypothetical protein